MMNDFIAWLMQHGDLVQGLEALLAIAAFGGAIAFFPVRSYLKRREKTPQFAIANPEAIAQVAAAPAKGTVILNVEDFTDLQSKALDVARTELATSHGDERKRLEEKIDALNARLADPDRALAEQQAIIVSLEEKLSRQGNQLGGDATLAAKAALEAGDFTKARALFETLVAQTAHDVQTHADAAFALGQIAETDIRWHDAANHYATAARLNPGFDTLPKARGYAWLAGDYPAAFRLGEDLLAWARSKGNQEQLAEALNAHALTLDAQGSYPEAEVLYLQALEIARATIGTDHPDYAAHLNNLAEAVRAQGRYPEAEALFLQALEIDRATIGTNHPDYATRLNNLAEVVRAQGRYAEARGLFAQSVKILRDKLGDGHPNTKTGAQNYLDLLQKQFPGDPDIPALQALVAG